MAQSQGTRIAILAPAQSPTRDLYLTPRLETAPLPVHRWDLGQPAPCAPEGTFVIIVRYVDAGAVRWLRRNRHQLAGVALLLDDDMAGAIGDRSLPRLYRFKLARYWWRYRHALWDLCDQAWVSSPAIAKRLQADGFAGPLSVIDPVYGGPALPRPAAAQAGPVTVFYHGLPTHTVESLWLRDVVAEVQRHRDDVLFEISGRAEVKRAFADVPRVRVIHPMTYAAYGSYLAVQRFDMGLAPLLDTVFNRSRSCTKAYDIAATGAVGLYARGPVYDRVIRHDHNGLLLPMDKAAWAEAILALAGDHARRDRLRMALGFGPYRTPETLDRLCGTGG